MTEPTPQGPEPTPPDGTTPPQGPRANPAPGDLWWPEPDHPDVPRFTYSLPPDPPPHLMMPDAPAGPVATHGSRGGTGNRLAFAGILLAIITSIAVVVAAFEVVPGRDVHRVIIPDDNRTTTTQQGTGGSSAAKPLDIQDAIVNITTTLDRGEAAGTGIVLTADGEVITNHHVIAGATSIEAVDIGNGKTYKAHVVGYSASEDIAILQLEDASGLATARLGDSSQLKVGDAVTALGNALGRGGPPAITTGHVTALDQDITVSDDATGASQDMHGLIQIDAVLQPGDSGGPLVNDQGEVVGIDAAGSGGVQLRRRGGGTTEGFAIPIATAMDIRQQIDDGKGSETVHVGPTARLGVRTTATGGSGGVLVVDVASDSPAEDAGLQPTDTITAIDGKGVASPTELSAVIQAHAPGDKVELVWSDRSGQENHATVTLEEGPPG